MRVGIFDSGLGGLSVVSAVQAQMPSADIVYVGDTLHVPYGDKSPEEILCYSQVIMRFLVSQQVDMILVACNTSSALLFPEHDVVEGIPVFGLLQAGSLLPRDLKHVLVLATQATVNSGAYAHHIQQFSPSIQVTQKACPPFVPLVESGQWKDSESAKVVKQVLADVHHIPFDGVVFGCSHYPFLKQWLSPLFPQARFFNPADHLADQVALRALPTLNSSSQGQVSYFITHDPLAFEVQAAEILGKTIQAQPCAIFEGLVPSLYNLPSIA